MMSAERVEDTTRVQELVEQALQLATLPSVVVVTERTEANLRWANNALTTNGEMHNRTLTVTATAEVVGGTAAGTVSREIAGTEDVAAVVAAAEQLARTGTPAEDAIPLVEKYDHGDDWEAEPEATDIDVLGDFAAGLGEAFGRARANRQLMFGFAEHVVSTTYLGSSTGLRRRGVQPTGRLELNAKTGDLSASAWVGRATRDFTDVDIAEVCAEASTRLGWAEVKIELPPGPYETLLPPGPVADLLIYTYWTANARNAEEGRNVFAAGDGRTRIGESLSPLPITLKSDPLYPGLETVPFVSYIYTEDETSWMFDLGAPVTATNWIDNGVLRELVRNRAHAAKTGLGPTPPADNLIMDGGGSATLEEMIATTKRGLLLTCLWYIRDVDPERLLLTGLTRDGVYLVEDGVVVGAVNNFRWNESPVELLGRITEIGASELTLCREWNDYFNRTIMPPIRIPDFNMSTVSQAS
ncbi:MAG TPA: metallopeptidase TldD-related protein [Propionibacteriaceae bacterium]|nr:metallopeptidase TldD-related protein [Propionibacteriaceae bacterium]